MIMDEDNKRLGNWLRALIEERQFIPVFRYIQLLNLVHTLYFVGLITKDSIDRFDGLFEIYDCYRDNTVRLNKDGMKTVLYKNWKSVIDRTIRIIAHDDYMVNYHFNKVQDIIDYLNRFDVPFPIFTASVDGVRWLVNQPFYYDWQEQSLLYVNEIKKDDGRVVKALVTLKPEEDEDIENRKGTVLYYGVEDVCFDRENKVMYAYMPKLHGVVCNKRGETSFLKKHVLLRDDIKYEDFTVEEWETLEEEVDGKVGTFTVSGSGTLENVKLIDLCDAEYDFKKSIAKPGEDAAGVGVVCFDCKEQRFVICLPQSARIDTAVAIREAFHLSPEETTYQFCTDNGTPIIGVAEAYTTD